MTEKTRVAMYCRSGHMDEGMAVAYAMQRQHYDELIKSHKDWEHASLYIDYEAGGDRTSAHPRPELERMLGACRAGEIDLVVTRSVSRLNRNVAGAIALIRELRALTPPVGFFFEDADLNTLDADSDELLRHLAQWIAKNESRTKHDYMPGCRFDFRLHHFLPDRKKKDS